MKITIKDDFFKIEMTGEFESIEECKEFYSSELGTEPENINIIKIEGVKEMTLEEYWKKVNTANTLEELEEVNLLVQGSDGLEFEAWEELMEAIAFLIREKYTEASRKDRRR